MSNDIKWLRDRILLILVGWAILIVALFCLPKILGLNNDESLALAQVIIEAILIPVAAIGFIWSYREVKNAVAPVVLALGWEDGEKGAHSNHFQTIASDEDPEFPRYGHSIYLINSGQTVSTWFAIEMIVPYDLCIVENAEGYIDPNTWERSDSTEGGAWEVNTRAKGLRVFFASNGTVASYPNLPLRLGTIWHTVNSLPIGIFKIPFSIYVERGNSIRGQLTLDIKWM